MSMHAYSLEEHTVHCTNSVQKAMQIICKPTVQTLIAVHQQLAYGLCAGVYTPVRMKGEIAIPF